MSPTRPPQDQPPAAPDPNPGSGAADHRGFLDFFRPAFNASRATERKVVRTFTTIGVLTIVWMTVYLFVLAWKPIDPDSKAYEMALAAKAAWCRLRLAVPICASVMLTSLVSFQVLDHTQTGKRLWRWAEMDTERTEAAKTLVAGMVFCALILTFGLVATAILK